MTRMLSITMNEKTKYSYMFRGSEAAIRVMDHIRTVYFAIADGQLPSNIGAGCVIRRT